VVAAYTRPIPRGWFLRGPSVRAHADQPGLCEV